MKKEMKKNIEESTHVAYHTVRSFARAVGITYKTIYDILKGKKAQQKTLDKIWEAGFNPHTFKQEVKPYIHKKGCVPDAGAVKPKNKAKVWQDFDSITEYVKKSRP